jgi:eukaryotic-like serine/threonine-protein kinase
VEEGEHKLDGESPGVAPGKLTALLQELAATPHAAQASAWEQVLRPGASVGRFELVRELGSGGFGVVWEARDKELGRNVAFKAVRSGGKPGLREERLLQEAEAAARLSHPNLVTLHDVGRTEHGPYLVLELLRGETLEERLALGPISVREALRVGIEIAKGVAHAHARGVVHRDLKPANVFLCEDGQVKVLDFGLAHAFGQRRADGGTSGYMAPEQVEGAPEDERTDVFALGVILYRMLSGEAPYPPARARRTPPNELDLQEAPALGPFVQRMLALRPTDRPRGAGEVLAALSPLQAELERAGGGAPRVRKRHRKARLWGLAAGGVAAAAVLVAATAYWPSARRAAPEPTPSVAVLPFADLSPQHDQEYFADGVAEEILNALAHVDGLRVPGRTSSFFFRGKNVELSEIGRRLNVKHVVEGSVRRSGDRVRITAQVVNVANGYQLWSDSFDGSVTQLFDVQDRFATAVVRALQVKLLPGSEPTPAPPPNPEAYEQLLLGKHLFYTFWPENIARARRHFERAVAIDPQYAPAWALLSSSITQSADVEGSATDEHRKEARAAADRAIALAPDDCMGYVARTFMRLFLLWDWDGARSDVERALTLKKSHLAPYNQHALLLRTLGRTREAIAASRKATEHDPLNAVYWVGLGRIYRDAGELDQARVALERALELSPDRFWHDVGVVELLRGSPATALELFERKPVSLSGVAMAKHDLGSEVESRRALEQVVARSGPREPYKVATVYAWLGERDEAFAWLERAYAQRNIGLVQVKTDPLLRSLRDDPRYTALLRKMKLPVD